MVEKLSYKEVLSSLKELNLRSLVQTEVGWIVEAEGSKHAVCPDCGGISHSRHSRYWRKLRDLPLQGTSVILKLQLSRWRCRNGECLRQIFAERFARIVSPHAQQTNRLSKVQRLVGRALGGRPGQRLLSRLGMPVSRHTLLRQVVTAVPASALPQQALRVVGVDDWAWRKGQSFGTILVDLERSEVVDVLPTRSAKALSEWLIQHPEVLVVSRDRQGVYAEGARSGAPQALQVADRFHLTMNLKQAVERELAVRRPYLRLTRKDITASPTASGMQTAQSEGRQIKIHSSVREQQTEVARQRRQQDLELFQSIQQLRAAGLKASQIARHLGLNRRRIDRWLRLDTLPERNRMEPRPRMVEWFHDYLRQRWAAGCRHGRTLLAEIRERGYVGAFSVLARFLSAWRQPPSKAAESAGVAAVLEKTPIAPVAKQISPQVAAALLTKYRTELTIQQTETVDTLKQQCPDFAVMRKLVLSFRSILRVGRLATLHLWMERAQKTGIHALVRFVRTLKQDLGAVQAAVTGPWSNGPVEGHINRLKTLKRQMYGRAGVELLRARLLPEPLFTESRLHQS
jgi:transposase